jgi:hypothetical protein
MTKPVTNEARAREIVSRWTRSQDTGNALILPLISAISKALEEAEMRAIREWMEATAAEMKVSTYHDIPESKRYCGFCGQGDSEIGLENLVEGPTCCICIDCAEDAASSIRSRTQKEPPDA